MNRYPSLFIYFQKSITAGRSGSGTVPILTSIANYRFPGTAKLDGTFTPDLTDPNSVAYQRIEREFCSQVSHS